MNIFVCCKHVPDVEMNFRIAEGQLETENLRYVLNAYDASALEWALQFKEKGGAVDSISVVSVGPETAKESLRKALAMGGDEAFHIVSEAGVALDHHSSVAMMVEFFKKQKCDLILCGKQSQDTDLGLSAGLLASKLGYPYVSNAISIELTAATALVKRQGDEGVELIELPMPCLISCSNDMNDPRVPTLRGIMGAKRKTINNLGSADLGMGTEELAYGKKTLSKLLSMAEPAKRKSGTKFEGDAKELVSILIDKLQNEARVL